MHIVFDLEATCWDGMPLADQQETIEIGAVKINGFGEVVDEFQSFIRPVLHSKLSMFCRQLTGISQEQVDSASEFPDVMENFIEWCSDDVIDVAAWGKFDRKLLENDCRLHGFLTDELMLDRYVNMKSVYMKLKNIRGKTSFMKTILAEFGEFEGSEHRALSDAKNLAKLYRRYFGEWQS